MSDEQLNIIFDSYADGDITAEEAKIVIKAVADKRAKAYALEVIGEDEDSNFSPMPGVGGFDIEKEARNQLRAELRQRITTEGEN